MFVAVSSSAESPKSNKLGWAEKEKQTKIEGLFWEPYGSTFTPKKLSKSGRMTFSETSSQTRWPP